MNKTSPKICLLFVQKHTLSVVLGPTIWMGTSSFSLMVPWRKLGSQGGYLIPVTKLLLSPPTLLFRPPVVVWLLCLLRFLLTPHRIILAFLAYPWILKFSKLKTLWCQKCLGIQIQGRFSCSLSLEVVAYKTNDMQYFALNERPSESFWLVYT